MEQIVPINEESIGRFVGFPVCAVLGDGTRHYGIISRVRKGKLILNDSEEALLSAAPKRRRRTQGAVSARGGRSRKTGGAAEPPVRLSAFPAGEEAGYPEVFETPSPFSVKVSLDIANISAIFPLL
ncbi:hypothetical protein [Paenibacillus sp. GYB003]|uniref:hypothetical protein n=1 Tax=Paenibacillus sp. GYB003 TaxID=2994392 RepID=UPI002F965A26